MKWCVSALIVMLSFEISAVPSADNFVSVTNDWYQGSFSNVYELALMRLGHDTNDVVAAYLIHDWNMAFGYARDISNGLSRVISVSESVTNQPFADVFMRLRPAYNEYLSQFLPTLSDQEMDKERYKAYRRGRAPTSILMLKLIDESGLW